MQAVSGRHGLAAPVPTSCAVAHPSSPAFMLGTISLLAQEQYSTLSIPTNPRQTSILQHVAFNPFDGEDEPQL